MQALYITISVIIVVASVLLTLIVLVQNSKGGGLAAGFASGENISLESSEQTITDTVETDLVRYITAEFGPQITAILTKIKKEGASITLYNQLGMLYVRAGMYSNAIPVYQLAAKMGSIPAMNNLGNIASLQNNLEEAVKWYRKVLDLDPENATAKANLRRIESELEEQQ